VEQPRLLEPGRLCLALPRLEREGMRDPGIAAVRVVLDDDEATERQERPADGAESGLSVLDEVEAVRGEHPIERAVRERLGEVESARLHSGRRKGAVDARLRLPEGPSVAIGREDLGARPEHVGERERECALTGPELEPSGPRPLHPAADERDMIGMVHPSMIGG